LVYRSLQAPFLPSSIKRIQFNPVAWKSGLEPSEAASIDAFVTNFSLPKEGEASSITGDADMFDEGEDLKIIQVESLKCIALQSAEEINDRKLFSHTVWKPDISSGIAVRDEIEPDSVQDLDLVDLCERLSYFYYRKLRTQIPDEDVPRMHRPLFDFLDYILPKIERGEYPTIKSEWLDDSYEQLSPLIRRFSGQIDLELMTSVGDNFPAVVHGQSTMLEHMLADNMLNRYYRHGVGFQQVNTYLAKTAQQIAHRHPRMNILEIGAGTGGTTHLVLPSLGSAFASYTYTDYSTGFLHRAQEEFSNWAERMKFATLDIEQDSSSQDFEDHSFDLIIASNVLHATRRLQNTLQNVRRLLKPGGYLLSIEVTGDTLRCGFIFGGLPGWWLGQEDGRLYRPTLSPVEWNSLLRKSGFSGADSVIHDFRNAPRHSYSVLVSQAVDALYDLLRQPLATTSIKHISGNLLVIGGSTLPIARLRQNFQELLSCWEGTVTVVDSFEAVNLETLQSLTTVLSITELDEPLFKFMTPKKFKVLQDLFQHARNVLWITEGCRADNPYCNITVGLGRVILSESPYLRLQFFDVDHRDNLSPQCLCETFLRFMLAASQDIAESNQLWTTEPELALEEGKILVPRILPLHAMNERLNAHKRSIVKEAACSTPEDKGGSMRTKSEAEASFNNSYENSFVRVHVIRSSRYAVKFAHQTFLFLCLGSIPASGHEKFLALSRSNDPVIDVPRNWTIRCDVSSGNEQEILPLMTSLLIARQVFETEPAEKILLYSDDEMLCRIFTSKGFESGRTVWCCASALQDFVSQYSVIFIHPQAPQRTIRSLLPSDISAFIDFSNTSDGGSLITECLPPSCSQQKVSSYLKTESVYSDMALEKKFDSLLQIVYTQSLETSQSRFAGSDLSVVRVEDLKTGSFTYPLLTSIIWTSASLPVQVKPIDPRNLFRSNRSYLLVGLTGELGQSLCRWMVSNGARYIVVSSRSPQKACKWQQELQQTGATIMVEAMDITDMEAIQMLYDKICARLPPIAGVANGAMVLSDSAFLDMDFESLNRVLRPKVDGSANMETIFRDHDLDFFVMFSSLAAIVGNPGQANYAAANNVCFQKESLFMR
jgi:ubiquinone/menaquinone biosynthesis C-methylase UbiE